MDRFIEELSNIAKVIVKDEPKPDTVTVTGRAKEYNGKMYVQIDGSDQLTPIASSTVGIKTDDWVTVQIKNHSATVTGNATDPSPGTSYADEINDKVDDVSDQISEFEIVIADKVDTDQLNAVNGRIDDLVSENVTITGKLDAVEGEIDDLQADNVTITGKLDAAEADIDHLESSKADISVLESEYATIENLEATNADIHNLEADYASFKQVTTEDISAINGNITNLETEKLDAESADIRYAKIDFANIGIAAVEELFAKSGIIEDLVVSSGHITGELVGVTIKGDLIEGNTIKADKLVVLGSDGLYYKLNVNGESVAAEQTQYNSLNGSVITANTITAEKINVDDLVAFNATIGGFHLSSSSMYSGAKASVDNTTPGVYLGSDGQLSIGDQDQYLKFYKDTDGSWKLELAADAIKMGTTSIKDYIVTRTSLTANATGGVLSIGENAGKPLRSLTVYGNARQNLWMNPGPTTSEGITVTPNKNGSVTVSGTTTDDDIWIGYVDRFILRPGSVYTVSVNETIPANVGFRIEPRDSNRALINTEYSQLIDINSSTRKKTFTVPSNTAYCNFLFYSKAPVGTAISGTYHIMLNDGSEPEPWCPPGLNGVDELSVVCAGRNLYGGGDVSASKYAAITVYPYLSQSLVGQRVRVSFDLTTEDGGTFSVYAYQGSGLSIAMLTVDNPLAGITIDTEPGVTVHFSATGTVFYKPTSVWSAGQLYVYNASSAGYVRLENIQIELGEVETGYEPYRDSTTAIDLDGHILNSLPDGTRDELSVDATGAVTLIQKTWSQTIDGLDLALDCRTNTAGCTIWDDVLEYDSVGPNGSSIWLADGVALGDVLLPGNTIFGKAALGFSGTSYSVTTRKNLYVNAPCDSPTDYAGARAWLNANPLTIIYKLATPQTIALGTISLPNLNPDRATVYASAPVAADISGEYWTTAGSTVADAQLSANEADQRVTDVREELQTEIDTSIEQVEGQIISTVKATYTTKDEFENEIATIGTQITQNQESVNFQFSQLNGTLADLNSFKGTAGSQLETITKYIRFLNGDIVLGGTDSDVQLKIENDRIAFLDNNNEVMYITNEELYIMRAIIATQLTIGNFSWVPRSNGNVSFRYIGS